MGGKAEELLRKLEEVPDKVLEEVLRYEEELRRRAAASRSRRPFPSNEDVVEAIMEVSGGVLTRSNIDELYDAVIRRLEEKGFETRFVTESRFWRLVTSLARKRRLKLRL